MKSYAKVLLFIAAFASPLGAAFADNVLLEPDWTDATAQRALESRAHFETISPLIIEELRARTQSFSLPVLGLLSGFQAPQPSPALRAMFMEPTSQVRPDWWPRCATPTAKTATADDASGTWYSTTYDYGCVTVIVAGDRNSSTDVPAGLVDALSEKQGDRSGVVDENDEPGNVLSKTFEITRFRIPYTVTIECVKESASLCADSDAQRALLARLSIVAGAPTH